MNKRIRYMKTTDGGYISRRVIKTHHGDVFVKYYADSLTVLILDASQAKALEQFTCSAMYRLKIDIKSKLVEMGAEFEAETRHRE